MVRTWFVRCSLVKNELNRIFIILKSRWGLIMNIFVTATTASILLFAQSASASFAVDALLDVYRFAGAGPFSAEAGQRLWAETQSHNKAPSERSCSSCHTNNLSDSGKHVKTQNRLNRCHHSPTSNDSPIQKRSRNGSCVIANGHLGVSVVLRKKVIFFFIFRNQEYR